MAKTTMYVKSRVQKDQEAYEAGRSGASKPPSDDPKSMEAYRAGRREHMRKQNLDPKKKAVNERGRQQFDSQERARRSNGENIRRLDPDEPGFDPGDSRTWPDWYRDENAVNRRKR